MEFACSCVSKWQCRKRAWHVLFILEGLEHHPLATDPPKPGSVTDVSPVCQFMDAKQQIPGIPITLLIKNNIYAF